MKTKDWMIILIIIIAFTIGYCGLSAHIRGLDVPSGLIGGALGCAIAVGMPWVAAILSKC